MPPTRLPIGPTRSCKQFASEKRAPRRLSRVPFFMCQISPLGLRTSHFKTTSASAATTPSGPTNTGLMSTSLRRGASAAAICETATRASASASLSAGGLAAIALEQLGRAQLGDHLARGLDIERGDAIGHVLQHLGEHAAEPQRHHRPEARIVDDADQRLEARAPSPTPARRRSLAPGTCLAGVVARRCGGLGETLRAPRRACTPPASVLCGMSRETTLTANGAFSLRLAAATSLPAATNTSLATGMPNARSTALLSASLSVTAPAGSSRPFGVDDLRHLARQQPAPVVGKARQDRARRAPAAPASSRTARPPPPAPSHGLADLRLPARPRDADRLVGLGRGGGDDLAAARRAAAPEIDASRIDQLVEPLVRQHRSRACG